MMARCPVCQSVRIVVVISSTRRAFCTRCGARWLQEGSVQRSIKRFGGSLRVAGNTPPMQ